MYKFQFGKIVFPIAPSKLTVKINNTNKTMELINGSEINFIRTPGLTEYSFELLLPMVKYPFGYYPDGFKSADYYLEALELLKVGKKPFSFTIYRTMPNGKVLFDTSTKVSLEDYDINENAKDGFDITVSVKLKKYVEHKTIKYTIAVPGTMTTPATVKAEPTRESDKELPKAYTVKAGDTLWAICKSQLGNGAKYKEIAAINDIANPNKIQVGQVIKLG